MKVKTKKGIVDTTKSIDELSKSIARLGKTSRGTVDAVNGLTQAFYNNWKSGYKPQKQVIIWILPTLTILFGLAVIAWYVLVSFYSYENKAYIHH